MCNNNYEIYNLENNEKLNLEKVSQLKGSAMLKANPNLFKTWSFIINSHFGMDIWKVTRGSDKKAWWYCEHCDEVYDCTISHRIAGNACPFCTGRRVGRFNNLAVKMPEVAKEWCPTLNGDLTPYDVTFGASDIVWWKCTKCTESYDMKVSQKIKNNNCPYCAGYRIGEYNNFKATHPEVAELWDYEKNGNKLPEHYVKSHKKEKFHWKCKVCGDETYTSIDCKHGCAVCKSVKVLIGFNDMWTTNPMMASWLLDPEDGYKYMENSNLKTNWKCPNCENIVLDKLIGNVKKRGVPCSRCGQTYSYAEKVMSSLLYILHGNYIRDVAFKWSNNRRYDFYIREFNLIIEMHGIQHYQESRRNGSRTLEEEQTNDKYKYELAIANGIPPENYIVIDCRKSDFEFIKNNILNSRLVELFDLSNIDWNDVFIASLTTTMGKILNLANEDFSPKEISEKLKLANSTVLKYIKNLINEKLIDEAKYTKYKSVKTNINYTKSPIARIKNNEVIVYENIKEAAINLNVGAESISRVCRGKRSTFMGYKWTFVSTKYYKNKIINQ